MLLSCRTKTEWVESSLLKNKLACFQVKMLIALKQMNSIKEPHFLSLGFHLGHLSCCFGQKLNGKVWHIKEPMPLWCHSKSKMQKDDLRSYESMEDYESNSRGGQPCAEGVWLPSEICAVQVLVGPRDPGTSGTKRPACFIKYTGYLHFWGCTLWLLMGVQSVPVQNVSWSNVFAFHRFGTVRFHRIASVWSLRATH